MSSDSVLARRITTPTSKELIDMYLDSTCLAVCEHFQLTKEALLAPTRHADRVRARQIFTYICVHHFGITITNISRFLNRDHATVIYSNRIAINHMDKESLFAEDVEVCLSIIRVKNLRAERSVISELARLIETTKDHLTQLEKYLVIISTPGEAAVNLETEIVDEMKEVIPQAERPITALLKE